MPRGISVAGNAQTHILVTGASGAIGRELVRQLKAQPGNDVVALNSVDNQRVDLREKAKIQQLLQQEEFDTIYHLGALNPFKSNDGKDYFETNVQGTENLLNGVLSLKKEGKKYPDVFVASSALVYSPEKIRLTNFKKSIPLNENALDGTLALTHQKVAQQNPPNGKIAETLLQVLHLNKQDVYYNDSKLLTEMVAGEYARKGLPIKVGRLVNCYGKESSQLMNQWVQEVKQGKSPSLQNKDTEPRDYLFCDGDSRKDDVLRLIRAVAEKGKAGESYNISSAGRFVRTPQAIAALAQGQKARPLENEKSLNSQSVLNNVKLIELGVSPPKTTPESGLKILRIHATIEKGIFTRFYQWLRYIFSTIKAWFRKPSNTTQAVLN